MATGEIEGFEARRLPGDGVEIDALVGGSGPPLLLLHGYPQTRMIWRLAAATLAETFTLVIPDLRGYGRSQKPASATGELYSKRLMARDQVETMRALGFGRFCVAGHDRGGRVAYRLAFDRPEAVDRLAVLDIVPTAEVWRAGAEASLGLFHWSFLAQPFPLPEQLIGALPDAFLDWLLERWSGPGFTFDTNALADYRRAFRDPATIAASCSDYRAGWAFDRLHDEEEERSGRRIAAPLLVLWGRQGATSRISPLEVWRRWAERVDGRALPGGHFIPEEAPVETAAALKDFFSLTHA